MNRNKCNITQLRDYDEKLSKLAYIAFLSGRFAKEMSEKTKRPVLFLANARSGTLLYYGVEDWMEQLGEGERREFVAELRNNPEWPKHKHLAYFETAQTWMDSGRISWFVYPTMEVKIASANRRYKPKIEYFPKGLEELLKVWVNLVLADISLHQYPASFGLYTGYPCFNRYVKSRRKEYHIITASRRKNERALEDMLGSEIEKDKNLCVMINSLGPSKQDTCLYDFIDNNGSILGFRGIKFGRDLSFEDEPLEFNLDSGYVRKYLLERIKEIRAGLE